MQPTLFPRLERVRNTSVVSSSLCEYWNSARSIRWSFHLPSMAPAPATEAPLRARMLDVPVTPCAAGPASGSGRKAYVGSGGRKASLAAMRLGHGGQQNRQQSSLRERPFILHCAGGWQEDHCAIESNIIPVLTQWDTYYNVMYEAFNLSVATVTIKMFLQKHVMDILSFMINLQLIFWWIIWLEIHIWSEIVRNICYNYFK